MKKFEWRWVTPIESVLPIPWLSEVDGNIGKLWAALLTKTDGTKYYPVLIEKDRTNRITIEEPLSLEDAKSAAEKKLYDDGIIQDGDEIDDYLDD